MLIALTGGIGSGKSTVARRWVELGATEIDADVLARDVVAPGTKGLALVVEAFGSEILNPDASLNRASLAEITFSSEGNRKKLESILHPLIQEAAQKVITTQSGPVVYTIPLFVESNSPLKFDSVVTISCPEQVRIERLIRDRGMDRGQALARVKAQATDAQREAVAEHVIDSNCDLSELISRADSVFAELIA